MSRDHIFRELLELRSKFIGERSFRREVESIGFLSTSRYRGLESIIVLVHVVSDFDCDQSTSNLLSFRGSSCEWENR